MEEVRAYIREHRNVIFTVVLIMIVDHMFLAGALRDRIRQLLAGIISKTEEQLGLPVGKS